MAKITTQIEAFNLRSTFSVSSGKMSQPTTATRQAVAAFTLPGGVTVTAAYVQLTAGSPMYGGTFKLGDATVATNATSQTPVTIPAGESSLVLNFSFKTYGSASAKEGAHASVLMVSGVELVIEYEGVVGPCTPPTVGGLAKSEVTDMSNVRLSWSGATAGPSSTITGYTIQRQESTDGRTWGEWVGVKTVETEYFDLAPGEAGTWRRYRVRTNSSAGSAYNSDWFNIPGTLHHLKSEDPEPAPGEAQPHDNMPPYKVVHMWRRIG